MDSVDSRAEKGLVPVRCSGGSYWDVHLEPLQKEGFKVDTWQNFQQGKKIPISAGQNDLAKRAWLSPSTSLLPAASIEGTVWGC